MIVSKVSPSPEEARAKLEDAGYETLNLTLMRRLLPDQSAGLQANRSTQAGVTNNPQHSTDNPHECHQPRGSCFARGMVP